MISKVLLVGAFDRFNYGDLLFPKIIRLAFERLGFEAEYEHYSLRAADLEARGGVRTWPLSRLMLAPPAPGSMVVVAGGELLSARWVDAHLGLTTPARALGLKLLARTAGRSVADRLCRRWLGGTRQLPWLLPPDELGSQTRVAYNAVGGTGLMHLPAALRNAACQSLAEASYLSVRDPVTRSALEGCRLSGKVHLFPDCAVLAAELLTSENPRARLDPRILGLVRRCPEGFLTFQCGRYPAWGKVSLLARQLRRIHQETGLAIVLLPVADASGHEDRRPLTQIAHRLKDLPVLVAEAHGVLDIAAHIAAARLVIGSSLHVTLTAVAHEVPRVGFGQRVPKLDAFLRTWDPSQSQGCARPEELCVRAMAALGTDRGQLETTRKQLVAAAWENFERMLAALS